MDIAPFLLERWQSLHEHHVRINLSDSGAHPLTVRELLGESGVGALGEIRLGYTQTNGTRSLRASVAALHPGATADHVLATTGGIEANFLAVWKLTRPGDEVIWMQPNYGQIGNLVQSLGGTVRPWWLKPDFDGHQWQANLDELEALCTEKTRLIAICHPNNPSGAVWGADWLDRVCAIAERCGAYVLADEIYRGAELEGRPITKTAWGRSGRVLVTGSLSKAWGLPGLRLGWVVGPPSLVGELWHHHDYTTIAPGAISDALACHALEHADALRARARAHLDHNWALTRDWANTQGDRIRWIAPDAGAMFWCAVTGHPDTAALAERLRSEHSVLIVPGEHYDRPGWIRLGFGGEAHELERGLVAVESILQ